MRRTAIAAAALAAALAACQGGARSGGTWDRMASSAAAPCAPPPAGAYAPAWPAPSAGHPLKAGSIDDNERFDDYLAYVRAYPERDVRKVDVTDARVLSFEDAYGRPLYDAWVNVVADGRSVWTARTTAAGRVLFPPRAVGVLGQESVRVQVSGTGGWEERPLSDRIRSSYAQDRPTVVPLDVAICLDTTGSMGDEIDRLKETLRDVVGRIERLWPRPDLRLALVAYRDEGDSYVTQAFDFTPREDEAERTLRRISASGGGDYPEAVNQALDASVNALSWRDDGAVRLLFLVGDAPPHLDRGTPYTVTMRRAVERGIKIVSVAASGLDDTGEFIWRQLAQFTLGRFVFLSYQTPAGPETPHHVGAYAENDLDDILVDSVRREVEAIGSPSQRMPPGRGQGKDPTDFARGQDGFRTIDDPPRR